MAEKVAGIIGLICVVFVWYNAVIKYFILKLRCTELISAKVEEIRVRRNNRRRHETLICSYSYEGEKYTSKLKSPDNMFSQIEGSDIDVMLNPKKPTEIMKLTRLSTFKFIYTSVFIIPIIGMFYGIAFGVGGAVITSIWAFIFQEFFVRLGEILLGIIITVLCVLGFKVLIIGPFIAKYTDKIVSGVLGYIEVKEGDTYGGKEWKRLEYKYIYDDIQYTYMTMTTDENIKEGDEITLKVNPRKPHKAYEPYSDPIGIKLISGIVMGVFLWFGITLVLSSGSMLPFAAKVDGIYGSNFEDNKVDASEEYLSQCNLIEVKENVTLYLPKEYKEYSKTDSGCVYIGDKKSHQIAISIEKNEYSIDHVYSELIKGMNEQESVIGEEKEYVYNNNKYLVYEVDRKIDGINKANYVITANSKYYMAIIIGWEYLEDDPTENILSSLEY